MTRRNEFSRATKLAAWSRCKDHCEECGHKIVGVAEYDHIIPCGLSDVGGDNSLGNCKVLCRKCHGRKTSELDRPAIDKSERINEKRAGLRGKPGSWGTGRNTPWKRKLTGETVRR